LKFGGICELLEQVQSAFKRFSYVFHFDGFRGIVADSAGGSKKDHGGGNFVGEDHRVVAGAAGHAVRLAACAADGFLNLIDEERIHRYGALTQQNFLLERQAATLGNFPCDSRERFDGAVANFIGLVPNIESHARFFRDYVDRAGLRFDSADRRNKAGMMMRGALDGNDPFCRGSDSVVTEVHRRCARMVGPASKHKLHTRLRGNSVHSSERPDKRLEDRALLDVKFQVGESVVAQDGAWKIPGIQSEVFDGGTNGDSIGILAIEEFFLECANKRTAADERRAKADAFFFGKTGDFDRERKMAALQGFDQSSGDDHSENAIVGSRIRDGIEVRAKQEPRCIGLRGWVKAAQISSGIHRDVRVSLDEPTSDFAVTVMHWRRKERAPNTAVVFRESGEAFAAGNHFCGARFCVRSYGHGH
jgi:hypothetical protein